MHHDGDKQSACSYHSLNANAHHHLPNLAISLSSLSLLAFNCITFFLCNILRSFMLRPEILELVSSEVFETVLVDLPEETLRIVLALADRRADSRILSYNQQRSAPYSAAHITSKSTHSFFKIAHFGLFRFYHAIGFRYQMVDLRC